MSSPTLEGIESTEGIISGHSIVVAARDQVTADLADKVVVLDLESGMYYGLDAVGARIWNLIQEPKVVSDVRDLLLKEYQVDPDRCEYELLAFLHEMAVHGLVEVQDAAEA
jgi:hypothetical protein